MIENGRGGIEHIVVAAGLVSRSQLNKLFSEKKGSGKRLTRLMIEKGLVSEQELQGLIEEKYGIKKISLQKFKPVPHLISAFPSELALKRRMIPLAMRKGKLVLAMSDPLDLAAVDDAARCSGCEIMPVMAEEGEINYLLTQLYSISNENNTHQTNNERNKAQTEERERLSALEDAPVVKMVNTLIERAVEEGASDIHLEPASKTLRIRFRVDGVLHDLPSSPLSSAAHIISRVKIMANLDIAEKRLPQDGNIEWHGRRKGASLRISTLPTVHGEKVVIRILEKERIILPLEKLGFSDYNYKQFLPLLLNHHGLLLVTGPTGSGKTTTLYSALNYLNRPEVNLVTVEDPVEYQLDGINQVQVLPRIKRSFAGSLRSILRQDPDIIMVGEIRDLETAKITTQAAMTGHLVLSTLHTNNAASAVIRLVDMGLEEYLVSASLVGVIAQRLVRTICPHCRKVYNPDQEEKRLYRRFFSNEAPLQLYKGSGCRYCNNTGYKGRMSIQEVLALNRELQELIMAGVTAELLQARAVECGMETLVKDGLRAVESGKTTVDEIVRSTFSSIFDEKLAGNTDNTAFIKALHDR